VRIHHDIQQNTDQWLQLRKGKFTASVFKSLFAAKTTAEYNNAINSVIFERLTGEIASDERFSNVWTDRGHELESAALMAYQSETFNSVRSGGFFQLNDWIGASPDGLVGEDGQVQIKCPKYTTMISYMRNPKLPTEYKWQVHGELLVTGRKWCDFTVWHPQLKPLIIRVEADKEIQEQIESKIYEAIKEVEQVIEMIKQ
jgi:hypothetical protein